MRSNPLPALLVATSSLAATAHASYTNFEVSHVHPIAVTPDGLVGGADPRREGLALGF